MPHEFGAAVESGGVARPASDAQLVRLGRLLGLQTDEAAALLDLLGEADAAEGSGPGDAPEGSAAGEGEGGAAGEIAAGRAGAASAAGAAEGSAVGVAELVGHVLRLFPPALLAQLRVLPGVFLLTDGVTPARMERALFRLRGLQGARGRLLGLLSRLEQAAGREARLLLLVTQALLRGAQDGRLPAPRWGAVGGAAPLWSVLAPLANRALGAQPAHTAAPEPARRPEPARKPESPRPASARSPRTRTRTRTGGRRPPRQ